MPYQHTDTHKKIFKIAHRLIHENGGFTMDQLAEESGISRATIYRQVGNRKDILKQLSEENNLDLQELAEPDIMERILHATRKALSEAGSVNFTIEEVANHAGLGVATIYRHFGNKTTLLESLANTLHPRIAARHLLEVTSGNIEQDLHEFAEHALQFMYTNRDLASFYFSGSTQITAIFKSLRGDKNRTLNSLSLYFEERIKTGEIPSANAFDLATSFLGMIIGFAFLKPSYTDEIDEPSQAAKKIVQIFLTGILFKDSQ